MGPNRSGIFSTQFAYYLMVHMKRRLEDEEPTNTSFIGWKEIWEMRVPNYVKKVLYGKH